MLGFGCADSDCVDDKDWESALRGSVAEVNPSSRGFHTGEPRYIMVTLLDLIHIIVKENIVDCRLTWFRRRRY